MSALRRRLRWTRPLLTVAAVLLAGAVALAAAEPPAALDSGLVRTVAEQLIAIPERGMGRPGAARALELIEIRLRALGLAPLRVRTTVSVAVDRGSELTVDDQRFRLLPHQPNLAATAGTGGVELTGRLVFVGHGTLPELAGKPIADNFAVLDGDTRTAWTGLAGLGAAAVLFSHAERLDRYQLGGQAVAASIAFPRLVASDLDRGLDGHPATLRATVAWEARPAWSLMAVIHGRSPNAEAVVLTAGYEANGPLDTLTPGATRAWNAALLLGIATDLVRHPPERNVVLVFNGGRGELMRGLRQLVAAITLDRDRDGLPDLHRNRIFTARDAARAAAARAALVARTLADAPAGSTTITALKAALIAAVADDATPLSDDERDGLPRAERARQLLDGLLATEAGRIADERLEHLEHDRDRYARRVQLSLSGVDSEALHTRIRNDEPAYQAWRDFQQRLDNDRELSAEEERKLGAILPAARQLLVRHRAVVDQRAADLATLADARRLVGGLDPINLVACDLSDGANRFSTISSGYLVTWANELGWLHKAVLKLATGDPPLSPSAYDPAPQQFPADAGAYWPAGYLHEAGAVGQFIPAVTFSTTNDARLKLGTPQDDGASFQADNFLAQGVALLPLLRAYLGCPDIANRRAKNLSFQQRAIRVETRSTGSKSGRRPFPFPFAVVTLGPDSDYAGDVRGWETWWGDLNGEAQVPFLPENLPGFTRGLDVQVYGFDDQGSITETLASEGTQQTSRDLQFSVNWQVRDLLALVFRGVPSRLFNVFDPRLLSDLPAVAPLSATRNAPPNFAHVEVADGQVAIFSEPGVPLLVTAAQGRIGNRLVLLGEPGARAGEFAGHQAGLLSRLTALDVAEDMWRLDDQRLALLRRNGIESDSLVTLHSLAERSLGRARQALAAGDLATASGAAQSSWAYTSRVYPNLLSTANDVVYGLVVLLAFAIPFAALCERLFLAGTTVARQVGGFTAFFLATFLFFYFFHPAFSLATTPMIIFLAFLIIVLSVWTIAIIYQRFEQEMEAMRMAGLGMHTADVSRLGTLFATVALGISNMRRRPLRTLLTGITVVLMTFILLTFASFSPALGTQRIGLDSAPAYPGVLLRFNGWAALPEPALEQVRSQWQGDFAIYPLRWLQPSATAPKFPLAGPGGSSWVGGVLGCLPGDPSGIERALVRGPLTPSSPRGFGSERADGPEWIFLPAEVLARIGVAPGAVLRFRGRALRAGLIDARAFADATVVGGEPPTPLAREAGEPGQQTADDGAQPESASVTHLGANAVAVLRESLVAEFGGERSLRGITLVPRSNRVDVGHAANDIAQQLALTLRVADKGESYLLTGVDHLAVAGLGAVLVPLILGGLIIFSTMLNSVAERGREIFIYASLGLAPIHVAALFLVEAGIYAVLGGLGGYMLAQLTVCLLGVAAGFGFGVQPDLNYSSFTAVATILLVMATVLLSALYPALVASRAANPGTSDFRLPKPDGDRLDVPFPFTVARRDVRGLFAFLARYLEAHSEGSTGSFTVAEAALREEGQGFAVSATVWLAPFDLGLSQRFAMFAAPTDVKAIYAIRIRLDLLSGQRSAWMRANVSFLKQLRLQFLVWRTLTPLAMDEYRALGGDGEAAARVAAALAVAAASAGERLPPSPSSTTTAAAAP